MDRFVRLDRLPKGLRFPPDLKERIWFDDNEKRLVYRGFMSKVDFDRLCKLSDDWGYRRPLEELFRLSVEPERKPNILRRVASSLSAMVGFA